MKAFLTMIQEPQTVNAMLTTSARPVSPDEAESLVAAFYDIKGRAVRLSGERDDNFLLKDRQGNKFLFKIANPAEDPAVSDLQVQVLMHIEQHDPSLPVQRIIRSRENNPLEYAEIDGVQRGLRLVSFVDGVLLTEAERSDTLHVNLGRMLARVGNALKDFSHPAVFHPLWWDIQHAPSLRKFLPAIADPELRDDLDLILRRFANEIEPRMAGFRRQVVHNDYSADNVVISASDPTAVAGVLDFGDLAHTPLVNDVAVAAAYLLGDSEHLLRDAALLIGGYHEVTPLLPDELVLMFDLILTRMALRITITEWRASQFPGNATYILRNTPRARTQLARLMQIDCVQAEHELIQFCHAL